MPLCAILIKENKKRTTMRRLFMNQKNSTAYKIALTGLTAALSYVVFTFLQIKIMIPARQTPQAFILETLYVYLAHCFWAVLWAE